MVKIEDAVVDIYTLRCCQHEDSLSYGLQDLLLGRALVDVTLVCDGGEYVRAHKAVLAACSNYFKEMFTENACSHQTLVMPDVKMAHLQSILEYIYTGEVNITGNDISEFFNTTEMLKINGLKLVVQEENSQLDDHQTPETAYICGDLKIEDKDRKANFQAHKKEKYHASSSNYSGNSEDASSHRPTIKTEDSIKIRRSERKRMRSRRAPSPGSVLRGTGYIPIDPLLIPDDDKKVISEDITTPENFVQEDEDMLEESEAFIKNYLSDSRVQEINVKKKVKRFKCPECCNSYTTEASVFRHYKDKHGTLSSCIFERNRKTKLFHCDTCHHKYERAIYLAIHWNMHLKNNEPKLNKKQYKCPDCKQLFEGKGNYQHHECKYTTPSNTKRNTKKIAMKKMQKM